MKTPPSRYSDLIKHFSLSVKQIRLYSENHPMARQSLESLTTSVNDFFSQNTRMIVGTLGQRLIVDGAMLDEKDVAAKDLSGICRRVGIESFVIEKGVSAQEILEFIKLIVLRGKDIEEQGGFKKIFDAAGLKHIQLLAGTFKLVEEGQDSDSAPKAEGGQHGAKGPGGVYPLADQNQAESGDCPPAGAETVAGIVEQIRSHFDGGQVNDPAIEMNAPKIVEDLEKNPKGAEIIFQGQTEDYRVEQVIRKLMHLLIRGLAPFLSEQGKDLTRPLQKLAKELERSVPDGGAGSSWEALRGKIPRIIDEGIDELRIQMMSHACRDDSNDPKKIQKLADKLFSEETVRKRLEPELTEALSALGWPGERVRTLLAGTVARAQKKKRVLVDAEELETLRRKAALVETESAGLDKKIQELEIENKIMGQEKERVESVVRNIAEGLLVVDENGQVVMMNPAAEKLLGVKLNEKIGQPVTGGLGPDYMVAMAGGKLRGPHDDETPRTIEVVSSRDETRRVLQASSAVIENEDGQTVGMVSVLSDVTKQKEDEELKTHFVANVSHELRTPLVAIQKSLALILAREVGEVNPDQERFLGIAQRSIDRLSRLINDLLDISKLEAGRVNLKPRQTPLKELLLYVISTLENWTKDKAISVKTFFPAEAVEIEVDPDRLIQVVTNLIGNAIKYTPQGGVITVEMAAGLRDEQVWEGECVEVAVRDNGIGIAPKDQERIFGKFEQVNLVQPGGISSTGLGLSIAREIVSYHSGRIWVESEPGKGSRFAFRLPVRFKLHEDTQSRI